MERIYNFRDFGGYTTGNGRRVKKGLLYRSGSLAQASEPDLQTLFTLGIRTICDLRTSKERQRRPTPIPTSAPLRQVHIPIKFSQHDESGFFFRLASLLLGKARRLNFDQVLTEMYREYVTDFRPQLAEIIRLATDRENLPLLIHCTAGKDRTGFACALIQLALGVPLELVVQDYLLTTDHLEVFRNETFHRLRFLPLLGLSRQKLLPLFEARQEYLEAALAQVAQDYGTVDHYLRAGLGFLAADQARLADLLLEKVHRVRPKF